MKKPCNIDNVPIKPTTSNYPEHLKKAVDGRLKYKIGDMFGLVNFGVNVTCIPPNSRSALMHQRSKQDEFVYVISGQGLLIIQHQEDTEEYIMEQGMFVGFPANGVGTN